MAEQVILPDNTITRAEAKKAFYDLREQASDVPEMSLDEINAEISAIREERKGQVLALLSKQEDAATVRVLDAMLDGKIVPLYHQDIL